MQNAIEELKREQRARNVRAALSLCVDVLGILAVLAMFYALMWSGCALITSCYQANI